MLSNRTTLRSSSLPVVLVLLFAISANTLPQPACKVTQSDFDKAAAGSRELAHDAELAVDVVIEAYKSGAVSLEFKDKALDKLKVIATNGQRFNNTLIELDKKYADGKLPPDAITLIRENFREVSAPFYELLSELNLFGLGSKIGALKGDIEAIEGVLK